MKKLKTTIIIALCILFGFILGACSSTAIASSEMNYPLKIFKENRNGQMETWKIIDEETGVNYIVVGAVFSKGHEYGGISITPRLNADGSLYTTE